MSIELPSAPPRDADALLSPMPRRALGRTGWNASALTLGGAKWDSQIPEADAIRLIHRALERLAVAPHPL